MSEFGNISVRLQDASLLRFLVDMRGADVDDRQVKYLQPFFGYQSEDN